MEVTLNPGGVTSFSSHFLVDGDYWILSIYRGFDRLVDDLHAFFTRLSTGDK